MEYIIKKVGIFLLFSSVVFFSCSKKCIEEITLEVTNTINVKNDTINQFDTLNLTIQYSLQYKDKFSSANVNSEGYNYVLSYFLVRLENDRGRRSTYTDFDIIEEVPFATHSDLAVFVESFDTLQQNLLTYSFSIVPNNLAKGDYYIVFGSEETGRVGTRDFPKMKCEIIPNVIYNTNNSFENYTPYINKYSYLGEPDEDIQQRIDIYLKNGTFFFTVE